MNELDELINKFKLKNNTPLVKLWINYLLIQNNNIQNIINQALVIINEIENNDVNININNNLTFENIITLYNINKFNNT